MQLLESDKKQKVRRLISFSDGYERKIKIAGWAGIGGQTRMLGPLTTIAGISNMTVADEIEHFLLQ